jgi:hypothetical protein
LTSDYGWLWVSNEPFGDIVYHYGRWVYDTNEGWLWVPGYVWGPGWVAWRDTGEYVGWFPLPPGYSDYTTLQPNVPQPSAPEALYGYDNMYGGAFSGDAFASMWIFVPGRDFARRDRRPYITDRDTVRNLYRHSKDSTHYIFDHDHDRIVNGSLDKDALERATKRKFDAPSSGEFVHSHVPMTSVTQGRQLSIENPAVPTDRDSRRPPNAGRRIVDGPHLINPAGVVSPSSGNAVQPQGQAPLIGRSHGFGAPELPPRSPNPGVRFGDVGNAPSTEFRRRLRPAMPVANAHIPVAAPPVLAPNVGISPAAVMPPAPVAGGAAHPVPPPRPQPVPRISHLQ